IQRSGLWQAVEGRVLVDVHKERALDAMRRAYPAQHYVMVDDKPRILAMMKAAMGDELTTVFVRQGHYAAEHEGAGHDPAGGREEYATAEMVTLRQRPFLSG